MNRNNYLVVIAIDKYEASNLAPLNNALIDTQKIIDTLTSKYGFELYEKPLFNELANRKNILETLNSLSSYLTDEDNLIIYYAGHGLMHSKTKKGFWVPCDATESLSDCIPNSSIIDAIEGIDAKHILLISDSCFSGTFLTQERLADFKVHYSKLDEQKSRWLLASGREEKVSDGKPGEGSPFANSLIQFLRENQSKFLSLNELFSAVQKQTGITSNQQPISAHIERVGHQGGQMVLINTLSTDLNEVNIGDSYGLLKVVVPFKIAEDLKSKGFPQESILAYYQINGSLKILPKGTSKNFVCSAYTFEEISEFIPEFIDVDENTYLAGVSKYYKLGEIDEHEYVYAEVTFQRTHILDTPFMAICRCRGSMVAYSITEDGYYKNLISWGKNQAEAAAIMSLRLFEEGKITFPDPHPDISCPPTLPFNF